MTTKGELATRSAERREAIAADLAARIDRAVALARTSPDGPLTVRLMVEQLAGGLEFSGDPGAPRDGKPRKVTRRYRVEPAHGDQHEVPRRFVIRETANRLVRDKRTTEGWAHERTPESRDVTAPMTRRGLVALIESAADWLAYLGEDEERVP